MLIEPVLGEGGYVAPPADFLPALRDFCDRHDLLLIADEVPSSNIISSLIERDLFEDAWGGEDEM